MPGNVLDENVVVLKFDNSDFEQNTRRSMDTLDKLKEKIKGSSSGEALSGLSKAANNIDLSGLSNAIEAINHHFSTLGTIGTSVIQNLTGTAISMGMKVAKAIPQQIMEGGWRRASNIEQAKFMIEGLGHDWEVTAEQAEKGMQGIKESVSNAVADTRYGLDEAAIVASQLMSSGVTDAKILEQHLQSISGLASVANAEYGDIGRIFAQVAGQGRMMGDQLLQISSRGMNAAADIKEYLNANKNVRDDAIQSAIAQGKQVKKMEELQKQSKLTEADVREMVSAGAISFEILSKSMYKYWKQASKANDTYAGSLANVKASLSRMGAQVMEVKLENMKKIFNALLPVLKQFETLIKPLTGSINAVQTSLTKFAVKGIKNIGKQIEPYIETINKANEKANDSTKKTNDNSKKIASSTKSTSKTLLLSAKEFQAAMDIWYKGSYGKGQHRADEIRKLGMSYENVQSFLNAFVAAGHNVKKVDYEIVKSRNKHTDATNKNTDATKDNTKADEKAEEELTGLQKVIRSVINIVISAKNTIQGMKNLTEILVNKLKQKLSPTLSKSTTHLLSFTDKLVILTEKFLKFTEALKNDDLESLRNEFSPISFSFITFISKAISTLKTMFSSAVNAVRDFFSQFKSSEGFGYLLKTLSKLKERIDAVVVQGFSKLGSGLDTIKEKVQSISLDHLVNVFSKAAIEIGGIIRGILQGKKPLDLFLGMFGKIKDSISNINFKSIFSGAIGNGISAKNNVFSFMANSSKMLQEAKVPKTFKETSKSLKYLFEGLGENLKNVNYKKAFKDMYSALQNVDWRYVIDTTLKFGSLITLFKSLRNADKIVKAAVGTMGSISGFFGSLSELSKTIQGRIKVENFRLIATSIAILIGSVVALAAIPIERSIPAMAGVVVMLGMMTGIVALLNSPKFSSDKMKDIGIAFTGMGVGIMLLANSIKTIGKLKTTEILKGGSTIVAFIGMMIYASRKSRGLAKSGTSFFMLAMAVKQLASAILIYSTMKLGTLIHGGTAILGVMSSLALASKLANSSKPGGFVAMAVAVNLLIPPMLILSAMSFGKIIKSGLAVTGLTIAMSTAAKIANGVSFKGLSGMAVLIAATAASMFVLSFIDGKKLLAVGTALTAVVMSVSVAAALADTSVKGIISLSIMLGILAAALVVLNKIDPSTLLASAISLAGVAASLAVAFGIFAVIPTTGLLKGIANLSIAIVAIGGIAAGLGALNKKFPQIEKFVNEGAKIFKALGNVIGSFIGGIVTGFTSNLPDAAKDLSTFMKELQPFLDAAKEIDPNTLKSVKDLTSALSDFASANLKDSAASFLGGGTINIGKQLSSFADGFVKFTNKIKDVPDDAIEKTDTVAKVFRTLATGMAHLPAEGGFIALISGSVNMKGFAESLGDVVKGIDKSLKIIRKSDISSDDVETIKPVIKIIKSFSKVSSELPASGGLKQLGLGNTTIEEFGEFLTSFIGSFKDFINESRGIDLEGADKKVSSITKIVSTMAKSSASLPESGGLKQFALGNTTINEFAKQMSKAIGPISDFIIRAGEIPEDSAGLDRVNSIAKAVKAMAKISNSLVETGGLKQDIFGKQDLGAFGKQLSKFMDSFAEVSVSLTNVNIDESSVGKIDSIIVVTKSMTKLAEVVPEQSLLDRLNVSLNIGSFGKQLSSLLSTLNMTAASAENLNLNAVQKAAEAINIIGSSSDSFSKLKKIPTGEGLRSLGSNAAAYAKSLNSAKTGKLSVNASAISSSVTTLVSSANKSINSANFKSFDSAGKRASELFISGMKGKVSSVKAAANLLVSSAESALKTNSNSGYSTGLSIGQGLINGLNAKQQEAYNAGYKLGQRAAQGQKDGAKSHSPSRIAIQTGKDIGEGLIIGMNIYSRKVYNAGYEQSSVLLKGMADAGDALPDNAWQPTITPVLDMSNVNAGLRTINGTTTRVGFNPNFSNSSYREQVEALTKMVDKMIGDGSFRSVTNNNNFTVNGAENPEVWGTRFARKFEAEMRTL